MLSMSLAACASGPSATPSARIVIKAPTVTPPAELVSCPEAPEGFPANASATITPEVRAALIRLAASHGQQADQLRRLIEWLRPGSCAEQVRAPAAR